MKNKVLSLIVAVGLSFGLTIPSYADGQLGDVGSLFGSATATIIDTPQGVLIDSLYRSPKKTWHTLAEKFGDENGLSQNIAGAMLGIPIGFAWGIPAGALRGAKHGMGSGWEKPFSKDSFMVGLEEK